MLASCPNKTYQLKDYKDVVNESRLKLHHSVDATAVDSLDDRQVISGFESDILLVEDKCCEDTVHCDGAHCNFSDDQQTSSTVKRMTSRKQLVIESSSRIGGQMSPDLSKFFQFTDKHVGQHKLDKGVMQITCLVYLEARLTWELIEIAKKINS